MDLGTISAAVSSLRAAGQIATGLMSLKTMAEVQAKAIELNQQIIAAQGDIFAAHAAQAELVQKVGNLEEQIAQMRHWEEQKQRYKLADPWQNGSVVYGIKESCKAGERAHWICTKCYDDGRRSILNPSRDPKFHVTLMNCPTCQSQLTTGTVGTGSPTYVPD